MVWKDLNGSNNSEALMHLTLLIPLRVLILLTLLRGAMESFQRAEETDTFPQLSAFAVTAIRDCLQAVDTVF